MYRLYGKVFGVQGFDADGLLQRNFTHFQLGKSANNKDFVTSEAYIWAFPKIGVPLFYPKIE